MSNNSELQSYLEKKYRRSALTIEDAANEIGVDVQDIFSVISAGELPCKKVGSKIIIPIKAFIDYMLTDSSLNSIDNMANTTVTSFQANEAIEIVEDDVDMGKGSITYVKQAGLWLYQLDLGKTADGKRIRKSKSFQTEKEARAALEAELKLINPTSANNTSNNGLSSSMTLKEFIEYYLKLENRNATSRTMDSYYFSGRIISEDLGNLTLQEVTEEHLIILLNKFKKKYSNSILHKVYLFLRMLMDYAFSKNLISNNLMKNVKKPKSQKVTSEEYKAFTPDDLYKIMNAAKKYPTIYPILLVFQNTGMRPGELRALKWENVDFENKSITIKGAATYKIERNGLNGKPKKIEYIGPTKSPYSVRTLGLSDTVIDALKSWREYLDSNSKYKKSSKSEFLFPALDGSFIKDDALRKMFRKFLKDEGLDNRSYHLYRFRHTMCTNLVKQGIIIPVIQRIMGDNTTDVILKIYTSVNSSDVANATSQVQQYFSAINNNIKG